MQKNARIVSASAKEVARRIGRGESRTDWKRVKAMPQAEVERLADAEDGPLPEGWESTVRIGLPSDKKDVHMRLDADVLAWFRSHGRGYQTRINNVLRAFVEVRRRAEDK